MTRLSDVLVAWAVQTQSEWERPVDMESALDRALAGMKWERRQLQKARQNLKQQQPEG